MQKAAAGSFRTSSSRLAYSTVSIRSTLSTRYDRQLKCRSLSNVSTTIQANSEKCLASTQQRTLRKASVGPFKTIPTSTTFTSLRTYASSSSPSSNTFSSKSIEFPWRLSDDPERQVAWPMKRISLIQHITLPVKKAIHRAHANWMVNGACGSSYWKIEFPTGAGIAFTQFCKAITAAFEETPATLATPGGENHVFSSSSSPSMKRLESILIPQLYDRLAVPIEALKKRGEAIKLSANVEDALIQEFYLHLGEPQGKGESTKLLHVEPSYKLMQRVSKTGRKGNLVTQQLNYFLVTPSEDEPGAFTVEQMMESMSRGIVIMVDILVDANITYVNTIKSKSKGDVEGETTNVLEEEHCRRQILLRLESDTLEMADLENGRGKDVITWRIADVDQLLESEQYTKYLEEEADTEDDE